MLAKGRRRSAAKTITELSLEKTESHTKPGRCAKRTASQGRTPPAEHSAKLAWLSLVTVLLLLQVSIGGTAIYLAAGDPSVAVVPDYHSAALSWDVSHRANLAAERMGWRWQLTASNVVDGHGLRAIALRIEDREGSPVSNLPLAGRVYHHAAASRIETVPFVPADSGRYLGLAKMLNSGLWQVCISTQVGGEPVALSSTIEIPTNDIMQQ